jgi:hypothetical protein
VDVKPLKGKTANVFNLMRLKFVAFLLIGCDKGDALSDG